MLIFIINVLGWSPIHNLKFTFVNKPNISSIYVWLFCGIKSHFGKLCGRVYESLPSFESLNFFACMVKANFPNTKFIKKHNLLKSCCCFHGTQYHFG